MPMHDLFCVLETGEKPSRAAIEQALALARTYGAVASVLVAGPKAAAPYSFFNAATVSDLVQSENEQTRARAEKIAAEVKSEMSKGGIKGDVDICLELFDHIKARARTYALCNDLTVIDRPGGVIEHSEILFEEMLFSVGRPVLLAVPDTRPIEHFRKIVIAWDGSPYVTRALSAALGLFESAKEADIVVVRGEKDLSGMVPGEKIAAHIDRHGLKAKVVELDVDEEGVSSTIDTHAQKAGADLVVMGAFGRSRLREFVLGGVTRNLTRFSSKPLLLCH